MGQAVLGNSSEGLAGVTGLGTDGSNGVYGTSDSGSGVSGVNTKKGDGVQGTSTSGDGVHGINDGGSGTTPKFGCGVRGESAGGYGVYGASKTASGVYGTSGPNHFAGEFAGDVSITGTLSTAILSTVALTAAVATVTGTLTSSSAVEANVVSAQLVTASEVRVSGNVTAKDVIVTGADCAEDFDIANAGQLEPGTVVVFDGEGAISQSTEPYNKRVAGVISGAGKYRPGVVLGRDGSSGEGKAPVALMGRVYCKVDASYSPIEVGDMLTTSPTAGSAMKVSDPTLAFGAVIGKALASQKDGQGLIPILVSLQ